MGKVVIQIEGSGNLTQDNEIIFIPEGNEPTYIYYNSTEIEFKDGNLYLLGESISNKDNTKESTTVSFDKDGFTKVKLNPQNSYTNGDIHIDNTGMEDLIICKTDPLCDINIDEGEFTIKGKVNLSYKQELIYSSFTEENIFTMN